MCFNLGVYICVYVYRYSQSSIYLEQKSFNSHSNFHYRNLKIGCFIIIIKKEFFVVFFLFCLINSSFGKENKRKSIYIRFFY